MPVHSIANTNTSTQFTYLTLKRLMKKTLATKEEVIIYKISEALEAPLLMWKEYIRVYSSRGDSVSW